MRFTGHVRYLHGYRDHRTVGESFAGSMTIRYTEVRCCCVYGRLDWNWS